MYILAQRSKHTPWWQSPFVSHDILRDIDAIDTVMDLHAAFLGTKPKVQYISLPRSFVDTLGFEHNTVHMPIWMLYALFTRWALISIVYILWIATSRFTHRTCVLIWSACPTCRCPAIKLPVCVSGRMNALAIVCARHANIMVSWMQIMYRLCAWKYAMWSRKNISNNHVVNILHNERVDDGCMTTKAWRDDVQTDILHDAARYTASSSRNDTMLPEDHNCFDPYFYIEGSDVNEINHSGNCKLAQPGNSRCTAFNKDAATVFFETVPFVYDVEPVESHTRADGVVLVRFSLSGSPMRYTTIQYKHLRYLSDLPKIGLKNIVVKDVSLYPDTTKDIVHVIANMAHVPDVNAHVKVLYDVRKLVSRKPDYGRYLKCVLEYMYANYEYDASNATQISLRDVYEDFTTFNVRKFRSELCHYVSANKFVVYLMYLGFDVKDKDLHYRKRTNDQQCVSIAPNVSLDKVKPNTSYRVKKNVDLRAVPKVDFHVVSPWYVNAHLTGDE